MATNLRRKDTTKGPPLRVLCLDGGGVRGYSMLIILQELMYRTYVEIEGKAPKRHQIPKPCDHFDLIAGTGTGGLIAIMLGRLRLDIDTCKDVYVRMTKRVFETDKTIAGIPYRSTLFKASRLEWAIQECVREHTVSEDEGNDGNVAVTTAGPLSPGRLGQPVDHETLQRPLSSVSVASGMTAPSMAGVVPPQPLRWGNPNASLYDAREKRTKTAVTAIYKGTSKGQQAALLRSYDSRKEPPPENNCTIWQAGRATCATGLAFKPIQIGQSMFIDEGAGKYNPAPQILDEAMVNEWPGREVGVFLSIGTGKRPAGTNHQQSLWWEGFVGSAMGDFAEARKRLISKIEGCEESHQYMLRECLSKRGVNAENYFRLNVEVGVGDFGMNEWNRLAEISTSTRRYLTKSDVQRMNVEAASKMARIHRARLRHANTLHAANLSINDMGDGDSFDQRSQYSQSQYSEYLEPDPLAAELPAGGDLPPLPPRNQHPGYNYSPAPQYQRLPSANDKYTVISSDEYPQPAYSNSPPRHSGDLPSYRTSSEYHPSQGGRSSVGSSFVPTPRRSGEEDRTDQRPGYDVQMPSPPPRPPKTPLPGMAGDELPPPPRRNPARLSLNNGAPGGNHTPLPYPDTDGPPPAVNMARKPEYGGR